MDKINVETLRREIGKVTARLAAGERLALYRRYEVIGGLVTAQEMRLEWVLELALLRPA